MYYILKIIKVYDSVCQKGQTVDWNWCLWYEMLSMIFNVMILNIKHTTISGKHLSGDCFGRGWPFIWEQTTAMGHISYLCFNDICLSWASSCLWARVFHGFCMFLEKQMVASKKSMVPPVVPPSSDFVVTSWPTKPPNWSRPSTHWRSPVARVRNPSGSKDIWEDHVVKPWRCEGSHQPVGLWGAINLHPNY